MTKHAATPVKRGASGSRAGVRAGVSLVELIVASTLMVTALTVTAKLTVSGGRMWQETRRDRVALEELSNQLDRLLSLPRRERDGEVASLAVSAEARAVLGDSELTGERLADEAGRRLVLRLRWGNRPKPMVLVGWEGER